MRLVEERESVAESGEGIINQRIRGQLSCWDSRLMVDWLKLTGRDFTIEQNKQSK